MLWSVTTFAIFVLLKIAAWNILLFKKWPAVKKPFFSVCYHACRHAWFWKKKNVLSYISPLAYFQNGPALWVKSSLILGYHDSPKWPKVATADKLHQWRNCHPPKSIVTLIITWSPDILAFQGTTITTPNKYSTMIIRLAPFGYTVMWHCGK